MMPVTSWDPRLSRPDNGWMTERMVRSSPRNHSASDILLRTLGRASAERLECAHPRRRGQHLPSAPDPGLWAVEASAKE